jgi:hypothetical protein
MDNKILYTAKFTHHDLKFHKVWWKSDKRFGSWSGQTDRSIPIYPPNYVCGGYNDLVTNPVICHERRKDRVVFMIRGTYQWSFMTQIFHKVATEKLSK